MLGRHDGGHRVFATLRDIVEIVAIVAAGFWALYVFVYEQRIKPAGEPPELLLSGNLHQLGFHNGLAQIGYNVTVRNVGRTDVYIVAAAFVADGITYTAQGAPATYRPAPGLSTYQRSARIASRTPVYDTMELTRYVNKSYNGGYSLSPDQQVPYSGIFLVKRGEFDSVELFGSMAYTKNGVDGGYPTRIEHTPTGAIFFDTANGNPDYHSLELTLDQISLW